MKFSPKAGTGTLCPARRLTSNCPEAACPSVASSRRGAPAQPGTIGAPVKPARPRAVLHPHHPAEQACFHHSLLAPRRARYRPISLAPLPDPHPRSGRDAAKCRERGHRRGGGRFRCYLLTKILGRLAKTPRYLSETGSPF